MAELPNRDWFIESREESDWVNEDMNEINWVLNVRSANANPNPKTISVIPKAINPNSKTLITAYISIPQQKILNPRMQAIPSWPITQENPNYSPSYYQSPLCNLTKLAPSHSLQPKPIGDSASDSTKLRS
jgi:hypothetical protein